MSEHAKRQAEFFKSASPSDSPNPDFYLRNEGRYRKDSGYDTTNFGNGTNGKYVAPSPAWYASINARS
jgi:hypothetical protein